MSNSEVVYIDPDGDVLLVCGTGEATKRLRVRSVILSLSSDVFRALLLPRFKEGVQLATASTVEIPLPDDDPIAMSLICNILHFRHDDLPKKPNATVLLSTAMLADKYACTKPLKHIGGSWIQKKAKKKAEDLDMKTMPMLFAAAFHLHDLQLCEMIGNDIIFLSCSEVGKCAGDHPQALEDMFELLEKHLKNAYTYVDAILNPEIDTWAGTPGCPTGCHYVEDLSRSFFKELSKHGLLTKAYRDYWSPQRLFSAVEEFEIKVPGISIGCTRGVLCLALVDLEAPTLSIRLRRGIEQTRECIRLPCLSCFVHGVTDYDDGQGGCKHERAVALA